MGTLLRYPLVGTIILCSIVILTPNVFEAPGHAKESENLHQFLKDDLAFSGREFKELQENKVVTKKMATNVKHEVAIFGIVRVNTPKVFSFENYERDGFNIETAGADGGGKFNNPPRAEDLLAFTLTSDDYRELVKGRPGDCKVKAPDHVIGRFNQLDPSAGGFEDQARALIQGFALTHLQAYLEGGNAALGEIHDKRSPVRVAEEFQGILNNFRYVYSSAPALHSYLEDFPKKQLPNATCLLGWKRQNFGNKADRPVVSVNHVVFYRRPEAEAELIVASKMLYASHYFETALGLTAMAKHLEDEKQFYLMHFYRARIDVLRTIPGFMKGSLEKGALRLLQKQMAEVKRHTEQAYHQKAGMLEEDRNEDLIGGNESGIASTNDRPGYLGYLISRNEET